MTKLEQLVQKLKSGVFAVVGLRIIGLGFAFIMNLILARLLGTRGVGIYFETFAIANALSIIGQFGFNNAVLRLISEAKDKEDLESIAGIRRQSFIFVTLLTLFLVGIFIMLASSIAVNIMHKPYLTMPIRLFVVMALPINISFLIGDYLKGIEKAVQATLIQNVILPIVLVFGLLLIAQFFSDIRVEHVIVIYLISSCILLLLAASLWWRAQPQILGKWGRYKFRSLFRESLPLYGIALLNLFILSNDIYILTRFVSSDDIGVYGTAKRLVTLIVIPLIAANTVFAPRFAALYARNDISGLQSVAQKATRELTFWGIPLILIMAFFPSLILSIFGPEFVAGSTILRIMLIGQAVNLLTGSVGYILMMTGHSHLLLFSQAFFGAIGFIMGLILVPVWGVLGAAIAYTVTLIMLNLANCYWLYRRLSIVTIYIPPLKQLFRIG